MTTHLHPDSIRRDGQTQLRLELDQEALKRYEQLIVNNNYKWPFNDNIVVFFDGENHWLADGFQREVAWIHAFAQQEQSVPPYPVDVKTGSLRDALYYSLHHANRHGVPFTRQDRREIAMRLIQDSEWTNYSNREIAKIAQLDEKTIRTLRRELEKEQATTPAEFATETPTTATLSEPNATVKATTPTIAALTRQNTSTQSCAENPQLTLGLQLAEEPPKLPTRLDAQGNPTTIVKLVTPLACVSEDEQSETGVCEQPAFLAYAWMEYSIERGSFLWLVKPVCRVCAEREMEAYIAQQG